MNTPPSYGIASTPVGEIAIADEESIEADRIPLPVLVEAQERLDYKRQKSCHQWVIAQVFWSVLSLFFLPWWFSTLSIACSCCGVYATSAEPTQLHLTLLRLYLLVNVAVVLLHALSMYFLFHWLQDASLTFWTTFFFILALIVSAVLLLIEFQTLTKTIAYTKEIAANPPQSSYVQTVHVMQ